MEISLNELLAQLDQLDRPPSIEDLVSRMECLSIDFADIEHAAHFADSHYQRNLLHNGAHYHALILCWKNGQRSPIHDHRGSACGVRIIEGVATETIFERMPSGYIRAERSRELFEGQVCGSFDADIHQISNIQPGNARLITLHVYSPPLINMRTYRIEDNRVSEYMDPILEFAHGAGI
jgi:cysteine dioxygenase